MSKTSAYRFLPPDLAETLRTLAITVQRPAQGAQQGLHRSPHFGASVEFAEYRQYAPGDPTSLIDWSVYARSDRYVIRRFQEETNLRATVLLDTSASLAFQDEGRMPKMEYACYLAAGVMYVLVNQGDSVGLMRFDRRIRKTVGPVGTFEGLRPLLLELDAVRPGGDGSIEAAIHEAAALLRPKSLVVIISDLLEETQSLNRGIRHLHHDGHNIMILHVLDPGERRLSFGGVADLRDMETGSRMPVEVDEIRDAYRSAVDSYLNEIRLACAECLVDYHLVDTSRPVEEELAQLQRKPNA